MTTYQYIYKGPPQLRSKFLPTSLCCLYLHFTSQQELIVEILPLTKSLWVHACWNSTYRAEVYTRNIAKWQYITKNNLNQLKGLKLDFRTALTPKQLTLKQNNWILLFLCIDLKETKFFSDVTNLGANIVWLRPLTMQVCKIIIFLRCDKFGSKYSMTEAIDNTGLQDHHLHCQLRLGCEYPSPYLCNSVELHWHFMSSHLRKPSRPLIFRTCVVVAYPTHQLNGFTIMLAKMYVK